MISIYLCFAMVSLLYTAKYTQVRNGTLHKNKVTCPSITTTLTTDQTKIKKKKHRILLSIRVKR